MDLMKNGVLDVMKTMVANGGSAAPAPQLLLQAPTAQAPGGGGNPLALMAPAGGAGGSGFCPACGNPKNASRFCGETGQPH